MMVRLFLLIGFVFLAGCLGERLDFEESEESEESEEWGKLTCDDNKGCVYSFSSSSDLMWQGCPAGQVGEDCTGTVEWKNHTEALSYCEDLNWGGFDDWELPNIDELRSLITGCAQTEYGSSECSITHQCSYSTNNVNTCGATFEDCSGCNNLEGPRSDGCYLPDDLPGECSYFRSSSLQSASFAYLVSFYGGRVNDDDRPIGSYFAKVRCVRSRP